MIKDEFVDDIELFERINLLKKRIGGEEIDEGVIKEEAIHDADKLIEGLCRDCPDLIQDALGEIMQKWSALRDAKSDDDKRAHAEEMFTFAHEIKDLAGLCGYTLIADIAESLRDYIIETKLGIEEQSIIVQAHIDAIKAAQSQNIRGDGGEVAQALKAAVKTAIQKFS